MEHLDETSDNEESEGDREENIIRAKWCLVGCNTLAEVVQRLKAEAEHYARLIEDGWELNGSVDDDYGFISRPNSQKEELPKQNGSVEAAAAAAA